MRVFNRRAVEHALENRHLQVLQVVQQAYMLHAAGESVVPFSTFLRPQNQPGDRIIGLPAYLGGSNPVAGFKWISSFPANVDRGQQRASSIMVLNDLSTGYPTAFMEASQISVWRTAASAALASVALHGGRTVKVMGIVGCGTINLRTADFLCRVHPEVGTILVYDAVPERAEVFARQLNSQVPGVDVAAAGSLDRLLALSNTVAIATTDSSYWLDLSTPLHDMPQVVLHLSLRDLTVESILRAVNVVDDPEHVCRENTSLDLARQRVGDSDFIYAQIGDILTGDVSAPRGLARVIFSPFGLGILDLAVAGEVLRNGGEWSVEMDGFDPGPHSISGNSGLESVHG